MEIGSTPPPILSGQNQSTSIPTVQNQEAEDSELQTVEELPEDELVLLSPLSETEEPGNVGSNIDVTV